MTPHEVRQTLAPMKQDGLFMFSFNMEQHPKKHIFSKGTTNHRAFDHSAFVDDCFTSRTKSQHHFTQLFLSLAPLHPYTAHAQNVY